MVGNDAARSVLHTIAGLQDYLPREAKHAVMCWRRRATWKRHGVIFVHVPKAAGTSVARAIYGRSLGHMRAAEIKRYCPDLFRRLPTFAVVRNPWDRLVSAYHFVRQANAMEAGVNRSEQYQRPEFRSFEAFIDEWLPSQALDGLDYVFQPQVSFVLGAHNASIVDFVGRVEQLADVETFLRQATKREDIVFSRRNASERDTDYRRYYPSSRLINLVGDRYRADVDAFGYGF